MADNTRNKKPIATALAALSLIRSGIKQALDDDKKKRRPPGFDEKVLRSMRGDQGEVIRRLALGMLDKWGREALPDTVKIRDEPFDQYGVYSGPDREGRFGINVSDQYHGRLQMEPEFKNRTAWVLAHELGHHLQRITQEKYMQGGADVLADSLFSKFLPDEPIPWNRSPRVGPEEKVGPLAKEHSVDWINAQNVLNQLNRFWSQE